VEEKTYQHLNPVWKEKANFIVGARIDDSDGIITGWEQLWCKLLDEELCEICCIPFITYNIALGDKVRINSDHWITEVVERSGHFTFRVWFGETHDPTIREQLIIRSQQLNCLSEWYSTNLLAISAPTSGIALGISGFLDQQEKSGLLSYETGQT
jgi:hypothetical protein